MKHAYHLYAIAILAASALTLSSCGKKKDTQAEGNPGIEVASPIIDSVVLHNTYPGYIKAKNSAEVVARVSGVQLSHNYKDGQYVKKGQVLFTIESSKYRDAVQQAQGELAQSTSQYEYYSKQYAAMKKALQSDAVSQLEVSQAESNMNSALASMKSAKAALETARTNLGYCTVTAPISGHISEAVFSDGNYVNGEGAAVKLATIYDDDIMKAVFNIEDSQYELMTGDKDVLRNPLYRAIPLEFSQKLSQSYTADLTYESPSVDPTTGTLVLYGMVQNPANELKDGMFVQISLPYGTNPEAILIRDASIGTDQLGKYVYLVNDSNKVVYTPIEVGQLYRDSLRIVNKGIKPGDRYVTKALLTVHNGETINPVTAAGEKTSAKKETSAPAPVKDNGKSNPKVK